MMSELGEQEGMSNTERHYRRLPYSGKCDIVSILFNMLMSHRVQTFFNAELEVIVY